MKAALTAIVLLLAALLAVEAARLRGGNPPPSGAGADRGLPDLPPPPPPIVTKARALKLVRSQPEMDRFLGNIRSNSHVAVVHDTRRHRLILQGEARHVSALEALIDELDKPHPRYMIRMRPIRLTPAAAGAPGQPVIDPALKDVEGPLLQLGQSLDEALKKAGQPAIGRISCVDQLEVHKPREEGEYEWATDYEDAFTKQGRGWSRLEFTEFDNRIGGQASYAARLPEGTRLPETQVIYHEDEDGRLSFTTNVSLDFPPTGGKTIAGISPDGIAECFSGPGAGPLWWDRPFHALVLELVPQR